MFNKAIKHISYEDDEVVDVGMLERPRQFDLALRFHAPIARRRAPLFTGNSSGVKTDGSLSTLPATRLCRRACAHLTAHWLSTFLPAQYNCAAFTRAFVITQSSEVAAIVNVGGSAV